MAKQLDPVRPITLDEIEAARVRIAGTVLRTPLVRFDDHVWLKLENLQPIGSFKLRGALSAVRAASPNELAGGVVTASAGNMAQGVAWAAREAGVRATIIAPDDAPRAKLDAVERLGGEIISVPHEVWWQTMVDRRYDGVDGLFVHPVEDVLRLSRSASPALRAQAGFALRFVEGGVAEARRLHSGRQNGCNDRKPYLRDPWPSRDRYTAAASWRSAAPRTG